MLEKIKIAFASLRRGLLRWIRQSLAITKSGAYRPERHYMRGSGPKSRALNSDHATGARQG
jgi:hypothetical protein